MLIGGLQRTSFCDFPGTIAAVVFTQGCNFNCPYCHNRSLIPKIPEKHQEITREELQQYLIERKKQLQGIVISGGEPTLQKDLSAFLLSLKQIGYQTKLDTNGSQPHVIQDLLDRKLLDYIAMDIKAPWDKYSKLAGCEVDPGIIQKSVQMIASSGIEHQFRTTWFKKLLSQSDIDLIRRQCPANSQYVLNKASPQ